MLPWEIKIPLPCGGFKKGVDFMEMNFSNILTVLAFICAIGWVVAGVVKWRKRK